LTAQSDRPFGQRDFGPGLRPTFRDDHYKFTILVPVTEQVENEKPKTVFTETDIQELRKLFQRDFGGYTESSQLRQPVWRGEWTDTESQVTTANEHVRFEIYSLKNPRALEYFHELADRLKALSQKRVPQQEILIEVVEVLFVY
jgi:hypothetical protein